MLLFPSVTTPLQSATVPFERRFRRALDDMRSGRPVILVDDFDRENEADLIVAAELISVPTMALLIRECSPMYINTYRSENADENEVCDQWRTLALARTGDAP